MVTQTIFYEGYDVEVSVGSNAWVLKGWDTNGPFENTNNKTINMAAGSIIKFIINDTSGHAFWIKTSNSTGKSNAVTGTNVVYANTGRSSDYILFSPPSAGTYYYNCEHHQLMSGQIIVAS